MHLCAGTSPGLIPPTSRFAAWQAAIITFTYGRLQIPVAQFTNIIQNMVQITPGQVLSTSAFTAPEYLRWIEKRWLPGVLQAPGQATAEDALACSVSWESKNSQNTKNVPPSAGGDQPRRPAAKHSLCPGRPSGNSSVLLSPVNQNRLWCSQQWSQTYHPSEVPHKPSVRLKLSFILMKATLRRGRIIVAFPSVKCPKGGTKAIPNNCPAQRGTVIV